MPTSSSNQDAKKGHSRVSRLLGKNTSRRRRDDSDDDEDEDYGQEGRLTYRLNEDNEYD